jgi:hypothetical protein
LISEVSGYGYKPGYHPGYPTIEQMKECRLGEEARVADWQTKHDEFLEVIQLYLPDWLARLAGNI